MIKRTLFFKNSTVKWSTEKLQCNTNSECPFTCCFKTLGLGHINELLYSTWCNGKCTFWSFLHGDSLHIKQCHLIAGFRDQVLWWLQLFAKTGIPAPVSLIITVSALLPCSVKSLTLHTPQATVHSSLVAEAWFAWHSMPTDKDKGGIKSPTHTCLGPHSISTYKNKLWITSLHLHGPHLTHTGTKTKVESNHYICMGPTQHLQAHKGGIKSLHLHGPHSTPTGTKIKVESHHYICMGPKRTEMYCFTWLTMTHFTSNNTLLFSSA